MSSIILHYIPNSIFFANYVNFIKSIDDISCHYFIIFRHSLNAIDIPEYSSLNIIDISQNKGNQYQWWRIYQLSKKAKIIFTHGYFSLKYLLFLSLFPRFQEKTVWVVWGHDIVTYNSQKDKFRMSSYYPINKYYGFIYNLLKRHSIKYMQYVIARPDEYKIIVESFNPNIKRLEIASLYCNPDNVDVEFTDEIEPYNEDKSKFNILIGHSGYSNEHHIEWIKCLYPLRDYIQIYLITSYGNVPYLEKLTTEAKKILGDSVTFVTDMLEYREYVNFIKKMDVGIFDAVEQCGLGCITTLLHCGKKVYLNRAGLNKKIMETNEYVVYSCDDIDVNNIRDIVYMPKEAALHNISLNKMHEKYIKTSQQWKDIFNELPNNLRKQS